jgi:hypothetical protein
MNTPYRNIQAMLNVKIKQYSIWKSYKINYISNKYMYT